MGFNSAIKGLSGISCRTKRHSYSQVSGILLHILEISDSNLGPEINYFVRSLFLFFWTL